MVSSGRKKLLQQKVARRMGCADAVFSRYLNRKTRIPIPKARELYHILGRDHRVEFLNGVPREERRYKELDESFDNLSRIYGLVDDETRGRMLEDLDVVQENYRPPYSMR